MHEGQTRHQGRSLISRFAASTAVLAAVVVVLAVAFFLLTDGPFFQGTLATRLHSYSLTMAEHIFREPEVAQVAASRHRLFVQVNLPDRVLAFDPDGHAVDAQEMTHLGRRYRRIEIRHHDGRTIVFYWDMMEYAHEHALALLGLVLLLLVTIGITYAFQLAQLRPLQRLRAGVDALARGQLDVRVPVVRHDEIGQVAAAFNSMSERVRQMVEGRERLLADVSHELRSPLARMKVALELLPPGDKRDALDRDVRQMESLTTVLLDRERLRTHTDHSGFQRLDFDELVREVVQHHAGSSPAVVYSGDPCTLHGDAALLRVLLENLISNALKYSLPDSRAVEVTVARQDSHVELRVNDDGPGIPPGESERLFEPFVKLDPARGHGSGYGLGLNLCQRIVVSHGGTIQLGSRAPRGTQVLVRLPDNPNGDGNVPDPGRR